MLCFCGHESISLFLRSCRTVLILVFCLLLSLFLLALLHPPITLAPLKHLTPFIYAHSRHVPHAHTAVPPFLPTLFLHF